MSSLGSLVTNNEKILSGIKNFPESLNFPAAERYTPFPDYSPNTQRKPINLLKRKYFPQTGPDAFIRQHNNFSDAPNLNAKNKMKALKETRQTLIAVRPWNQCKPLKPNFPSVTSFKIFKRSTEIGIDFLTS